MDASLYHSKLGLNNTKFAPHRFINLQYFRHVAFGKGAVTKATVVTSNMPYSIVFFTEDQTWLPLLCVVVHCSFQFLHSILMEKKAVSPDSSTHLAEKSKKSKKRKHKHR